MVCIKRIYDEPSDSDGYRILVDRLWPRGVSKQKAAIDMWLKEVAPSPALRTWFGHKPELFSEFSRRYKHELSDNPAVRSLTAAIVSQPTVTLLYAAKDPVINHAVILQEFLKAEFAKLR